jgi:hypothetical protein
MSDPESSVEAGWTRYFVKSSGLLQMDLWMYRDEALTDLMFNVVGDKQGAEISSADGALVMTAVGKKAMLRAVDYANADGTAVASMKKNSIFGKTRMGVTLANGPEWTVVKSAGLEKVWSVLDDGAPVVRADLKTLLKQRCYPVDIADSVDLPLAVGLVWAINFTQLQLVAGAGATAAT